MHNSLYIYFGNLPPGVFQTWEFPEVNLFATFVNRKCHLFCSRRDLSHHSLGDAFVLPWIKGLFYLFPPTLLILRIVNKTGQGQGYSNRSNVAGKNMVSLSVSLVFLSGNQASNNPSSLLSKCGQLLHPNLGVLHLSHGSSIVQAARVYLFCESTASAIKQ